MVGAVQRIPRVVVAGTHSGVGKTTAASGIMAALRKEGHWVAPFKVGPDFIDPSYHALATGRPGRNLDAFLSGDDLIAPLFAHGARGADVAIIEGVMGLFDGKCGGGDFASTAHIAKLLRAPVLLVVDAGAMARSVAALVHGYATFDPELRVAGVILNRVGSPTHEKMLREAMEPLGIPILGVLHRDASLSAPNRHLGLVPVPERRQEARNALEAVGERVTRSCDLGGIGRLAASAEPLCAEPWDPEMSGTVPPVRIAVANGPAFSFVYEENLELLRAAGAETILFDPTSEEDLPEGTDALYLGGGFPETYAEVLSENELLREKVRTYSLGGRPVAAECGGLLYLCRELDGQKMCGALDAEARMTDRLSLGYREARALADSSLAAADASVYGHEFHYSVVEPRSGASAAWKLSGGGEPEGFVVDGVHASYLHLHWAATPGIPRRFVESAVQRRSLAESTA